MPNQQKKRIRKLRIILCTIVGLVLYTALGSSAEEVLFANEQKLPAAESILNATTMASMSLPQGYLGAWESRRFWNTKRKSTKSHPFFYQEIIKRSKNDEALVNKY